MLEILCFDICALAILLVLVFALIVRKTNADEAGRRLLVLILVTILAAGFDISANYNNGQSNRVEINYICSGLYHVSRNAAFYSYASYIVAITGTRHKFGKSLREIFRFVPLAIIIAISVTAKHAPLFFYYDANHVYVRGTAFFVIYACSTIYALYALYYIAKNVPLIGVRKAASLASCAVFSFISSYIQYKYPQYAVDILGFTLSLLYIVLFIDNPGDKIESTSLLMRLDSYHKELKKDFYINKPIDIIHINITKFSLIEEMLGYYNTFAFTRKVAKLLRDIKLQTKAVGELFYLKEGKFRIILDNNDLDRTNTVAKAVLDTFNGEIPMNDMQISMEASVRVTQCPEDFDIFDNLLEFSTLVNQFEIPGEIVYSKDILYSEEYRAQININKMVEHGIINSRFEVYYQPIYDTSSCSFKDVEALIRLRDENNKIWEPEAFLPVAEQSGAIIELGEFVLDEVCKFINSAEFEKTGIERVSINLSVIQCLQKNLANQILDKIEKAGIMPNKIRFDITESLVSDNQKTFTDNIKILSEAGFVFALDDYGVGYSNITTLSTLPLDEVKFDESFADSYDNEKLNAIFEHSVEMVRSLGKKIAIEGVDSSELAERYSRLKCDYLQGNYYARPMTVNRLLEFYEKQTNKIG